MKEHSYSPLWLDFRELGKNVIKISVTEAGMTDECGLTALSELKSALKSFYPRARFTSEEEAAYSIRLGISHTLGFEEYSLVCKKGLAVIRGGSGKGVLYGVFSFLRKMAIAENFPLCSEQTAPLDPLRMLNHWDNPDGTIERGYSGDSFYFRKGRLLVNERTRMFARAAASVGINGIVINNVNVGPDGCRLLDEDSFESLHKLSEIFGKYGIKLYLSLDFAAPVTIGGLSTADPLSKKVAAWWKKRFSALSSYVGNIGGFLVKADSEGKAGPYTYGRDHADGANMLARAARPFGWCIIWRCFVYNCKQDWRDRKTDRACAAYDNFIGLDGKFDDNVILQIKNGPMDFQVREPIHPLFGAMKKTNLMLELQIAQEYTGQQRHVCCLLPMFREILDSRTYNGEQHDRVADVISSRGRFCGIAAVSNTGDSPEWTGSVLAAANLYGFGRMAFEDGISPEETVDEWCRMTFGSDSEVCETVSRILLRSHRIYEKYTAPLGLGWLCRPENHYGPSPLGYEFDRWGTYHYADREKVGVDRTESGTGFAKQYNSPLSEIYGSPEKCPDELKLFFHHLPYDHILGSGKTLIQHIYDAHFEGYDEAEELARLWDGIKDKLAPAVYENGKERFIMQCESAREWRDIINSFFFRLSGVADEKGRKIY